MKSRILIPAAAALFLVGCNQGGGEQAAVTDAPDSFEQKYSYALGKDIGGSLAQLPKESLWHCLFVGNGPKEEALKKLANDLNLNHK